ncbi:hypothetical protein H1R17_05855 [Flavobacterium sp. xlx-214]|uniref:hypothetical protein n=1 Tax=unclassified Flavobacterium TaxID=196869 RepID=UPI0013D4BDD8|nr:MULTISPECIES: hypothetical protein [unclassified Flavobacterium]MBA5793024.1 hypothetical protein [Flavobacterium sp. xlx-221]QMI84648.1 hypothetical protein H1R17_05855 [Flavobacterium sp. xlx-214]
MKNFRKFTIGVIGAALLSLGLYSCDNEDAISSTSQTEETKTLAAREAGEVAIPEVQQYYNNLKTIIFATELNKLDVVRSLADKEIPMVEKITTLDLVDEADKPMTFFDFESEEQQIEFIDQYLDEEALSVSDKITMEPELIENFKQENLVIEKILEENNIKGYATKISDKVSFFDRLKGEIGSIYLPINPTPIEGMPIPIEIPTKAQLLRNKLAKMNPQTGDFFVALPTHGVPFQLIDLFNKRFKVGHAGIVTKNITSSTLPTENVLIEAWSTVQYKQIEDWVDAKFYVMEFKKKKTRIIIKWFKVKIETSYHNVNKQAIANYAMSKFGKSYVKNLFEFGAMKATAKNLDRYTCTTLVWRSSDVAVDIKPSPWLSPIVTPTDLYTDGETFVKGQVN